MGWSTNGIKTIALAPQILAESPVFGADSSGNVKVIVSSTVPVIVTFEQRNPANDAVLKSQAFICPANDTKDVEFMVEPLQDQRFRLTIAALAAGFVQGSLSSGMW